MKLKHFKLISAALFLVACLSPIGAQDQVFGWHALIFGWIGVAVGDLAWFANIALIGAWCAKTAKTLAIWISLTVIFALWHIVFLMNASHSDCTSLIGGPGSYLWFASIGCMGLALFFQLRENDQAADDEAILIELVDDTGAERS